MFFCWRWWCVCVCLDTNVMVCTQIFMKGMGENVSEDEEEEEKKGSLTSERVGGAGGGFPVCLFVCVCRVQWSYQEASSVCEAILSQRIPSPICKHTPSLLPLPFRRSEHPPLWIPRNLICHCSAKKKSNPKKHFLLTICLLKCFSPPLLPSCRKPCPNATGHNPADLLLTPAWPFVG